MGVLFTREYKDIINDFSDSIVLIDKFYEFFEMEATDWDQIPVDEQKDCLSTLSDDLFYALGNGDDIEIGEGSIKYDKLNSHILVFNGNVLVKTIHLA